MSAPGAAPVLVVGNTGDPATPYEGARKMADELGKGVGVQLTWKGEGHGAYGSGSDCVDCTVNDYLLDGKVPKDGKVCDSGPGGPDGSDPGRGSGKGPGTPGAEPLAARSVPAKPVPSRPASPARSG